MDIVHFNDARAERNVTLLPCDLEGTRDFKLQGFYCFFNQEMPIQPDSSTIFIQTNDVLHHPEKECLCARDLSHLEDKNNLCNVLKSCPPHNEKNCFEEFKNDPLYENRSVLADYNETLNIAALGCN